MATALANATTITPKPVKKEKKVMKNTITLTPDALQAMLEAAAAKAVANLVPAAPVQLTQVVTKQGTKAEDTWVAKLGCQVHKAGSWATDKVLVPTEQYTRDQLVPDTLAVTASSTGWLGRKLDGISKAAAKKSESLRPAIDVTDPVAVLNTLSKAELIAALTAKLSSK
jgi:hypothetical protein